MRKLFWCGAILMVVAAASIYLAAENAIHHPDSMMGRGALMAYRVGVQYNPVAILGDVVSKRVCENVQNWSPKPAETSTGAAAVASHAKVPCQIAAASSPEQAAPAEQPVTREELAQHHLLNLLHSPDSFIKINDEVGTPVATEPPPLAQVETAGKPIPAQPPAVVSVIGPQAQPGAATEESEELPRTMPQACEVEEAPAVMPYADDSNESKGKENLSGFWMDFLHMLMPETPPAEKTEAKNTAGATEESDTISSHMSNCQVDPSYHQQYPGCPLMGTRSTSHSSKPTAVPDLVPEEKNRKGTPVGDQSIRYKPNESQGGSSEEEEAPPQSGVDTMEFRHSDAQPGEFQPHPM